MGLFSSIGSALGKVAGFAKSAISSIAGPAIGGGISFFGGRKNREAAKEINRLQLAHATQINNRNLAFQREQLNRNEYLQKQFARLGVRWRVADAKAAGLHPLYALGGTGASYSPSAAIGSSAQAHLTAERGEGDALRNMGQDISRAISAALSTAERQTHQAQIKMLEAGAAKDNAIASYYSSRAQREMAEGNVSKPVDIQVQSYPLGMKKGERLHVEGVNNQFDRVKALPEQVTSVRGHAPHIGAGTHAFFREYKTPNGGVILPFNEEGPIESIQSTPLWMWPYIYQANRNQYGPNWDAGVLDAMRDIAKGAVQNAKRKIHKTLSIPPKNPNRSLPWGP